VRPEERNFYEHEARKFSTDIEGDDMLAERASKGIYSSQNSHNDYFERGRDGEDASFLYIHGAWTGPA
jgi:hypothetical protein